MPYSIEKRGEEYCLIKTATGEEIACHDSQMGAERQRRAILANERKELYDGQEERPLRTAILITSNAYQDGSGEIIKQKALEQYVEESWEGDEFINPQPFLYWHGGDPIGTIVFADTWGPFLVEVAKELPDATIKLSREGEPEYYGSIRKMWDDMEVEQDWGTSHEFWHRLRDKVGGVYEVIVKTESSALPVSFAANKYTLAVVMSQQGV